MCATVFFMCHWYMTLAVAFCVLTNAIKIELKFKNVTIKMDESVFHTVVFVLWILIILFGTFTYSHYLWTGNWHSRCRLPFTHLIEGVFYTIIYIIYTIMILVISINAK